MPLNTLSQWLNKAGWKFEPEQLVEPSTDVPALQAQLQAGQRADQASGNGEGDFKKSDGLLREPESLRFSFIQGNKENYPVQMMCDMLEVSRSGYYAWLDRRSARVRLARSGSSSRSKRSSPSTASCTDLRACMPQLAELDVAACVNTVAKYMREKRLCARTHRRFVVRNHRFQSRPSGGGESAGSGVRAGAAQPGVGGGHHLPSRPIKAGSTWRA